MFIKISAGNLWRNKRRTIITEISIIFGIIVIIFTGSLTKGLTLARARRSIYAFTGAMQVEHADYEKQRKFKPLETTLDGGGELIDNIRSFPGVRAVFGQLNITGFISNGSKSTTFMGRGIEVAESKRVLPAMNIRIHQGRALGYDHHEIVVGKKLAENLNLKLGDPVMLLARTMKGGLNMMEMVVVGTEAYAGQNDYVSSHLIEISLQAAQQLMRMPDRISQAVVAYTDFFEVPQQAIMLQKDLQVRSKTPVIVKDYTKLIPGYEVSRFFDLISIVVGLVLFIIVGAGIANSLFMAVMERRKEIGTMKAIGAEQSTIRGLFLVEGTLMAVFGAVSGLILAIILVVLVRDYGGIPLPPPPGSSRSINLRPALDYSSCVYAVCLSMFIALIASYLPASLSSRLDPVETLREE